MIDGESTDVDSSTAGVQISTKACFRDSMKKASPIILEPIIDMEITTPQDHVGDVVGDINHQHQDDPEPESSGSTVMVQGPCPEGDVRVYFGSAQHDQGTRLVHDAVPSLPTRCHAISPMKSWRKAPDVEGFPMTVGD